MFWREPKHLFKTKYQPTGQEPSQGRPKTQLPGAESSHLRPQCYHMLERQAEIQYYLKLLNIKYS